MPRRRQAVFAGAPAMLRIVRKIGSFATVTLTSFREEGSVEFPPKTKSIHLLYTGGTLRSHDAVRGLPVMAGLIACMLVMPAQGTAQQSTLERTLEQYGEQTVKGYVQPIADLFGANLNSGFYSTARIPRARLTFGLELVGMGALVGEAQKIYTATTPEGFQPATAQTATVFGGEGTLVTSSENAALQYRFSDGLVDASMLPLAAPQIRIGGVMGTEVLFRYVPLPELDEDFPAATLTTYGVRHSISQYLPLLPVDIAAGVFVTSFTFGDYIDVAATAVGVQVSRSIPLLTLYGGSSWERTTMKLSYTSTEPGAEGQVDVELTGANTMRLTGGAALRLGFLSLFGDANLGKVTNFSGGLRLGL
jgi:hypothetical protein